MHTSDNNPRIVREPEILDEAIIAAFDRGKRWSPAKPGITFD